MRGAKEESMSFEQIIIEMTKAHGFKAAVSIFLAWIGAHLLPVAGFMVAGAFLVACDWITGVTAARKRSQKITSRGLLRTIQKITFYCMAIVLVVIVEHTFFRSNWMVSLVATYIALVELYSNLENISIITGTNVLAIVRNAINIQLQRINLKANVPAESEVLKDLEDAEKQDQ